MNSIGRAMLKGEIGCAMSHLSIYQKMIEQNIKQAIIFEDDIDICCNNFDAIIDFLAGKNSHTPQVTLLTKVTSYLSKDTQKINDSYNVADVVQAYLTSGYVINQQAAQQMLNINSKVWILADDWVRYKMHTTINIACVSPPIIKANPIFSNHSTIATTNRNKKTRTIKYMLSRYKNKIIADLKKYFYLIPFKGYVRVK